MGFYARLPGILKVIFILLPASTVIMIYHYQNLHKSYSEYKEISQKEDEIKKSYKETKEKISNLPDLKNQLSRLESDVSEVQEKLPDSIPIEEILQKAAVIALNFLRANDRRNRAATKDCQFQNRPT